MYVFENMVLKYLPRDLDVPKKATAVE